MSTVLRSLFTTLGLVVALLIGMVVPWGTIASAAQLTDEESYTTESGHHEVTWVGDWEIIDDLTVSDEELEVVVLLKDTAELTLAFLPGDAELVEIRELLLEGVQEDEEVDGFGTIDAGEYNDVAYSLDRATFRGEEAGIFSLIVGQGPDSDTVAAMIIAPIETFADDFRSAQDEITVDQDEIFSGIDPEGLQELLGAPTALPAEETRPTPAPEPTTTQAVEQPAGSVTSQEEAYFVAILDDANEIVSIMGDFGPLFTRASQNPILMFDSTWKTEVAVVLVRWQLVSEEMRTHDPSPRQQHIQDMWLEISSSNLRAIDLIVQGVDELDPDALMRGTACMNYGIALVDDVTRAITAFYEDPNAPFQRQHTLNPGTTCESFSN
jgi:hypothetical protein